MQALIALLSLTEWIPDAASAVGYTTSPTTVTCSVAAAGGVYPRFCRVQAIDGDLLVTTDGSTPGTGAFHVFQGTAEVIQMPKPREVVPVIKVRALTGTVSGSLVWGR